MVLSSITLQNFRSYTKESISFSSARTLVTGLNTTGKTNLLEAIFLLAAGKSFRADQDREVIRWGSDMSTIKSQIHTKEDKTTLEMRLTKGEFQGQKVPLKKHLVNGVARRMIDFVGNLRAVLFWPEDLELITDSPSLRRKYLDSILVQIDREYRRNLLSYERGLRQRNKLLDFINEGKAHRHQLNFWNELLIRAGGYLTDKRAAYLEFINTYHSQISHYQLFYDKSVISESRLAQYADEEIAAKATLVGPHRDDVIFKLNGIDLSKFGSRGEQRLAILWLKLAELSYIESESGDRPILLLDDIFSELDEAHRDLVIALIGKQQTIITSAEDEARGLFSQEQIGSLIQLPART